MTAISLTSCQTILPKRYASRAAQQPSSTPRSGRSCPGVSRSLSDFLLLGVRKASRLAYGVLGVVAWYTCAHGYFDSLYWATGVCGMWYELIDRLSYFIRPGCMTIYIAITSYRAFRIGSLPSRLLLHFEMESASRSDAHQATISYTGIVAFEPCGKVHSTYEFEPLAQVTLAGVMFACANRLVSQ